MPNSFPTLPPGALRKLQRAPNRSQCACCSPKASWARANGRPQSKAAYTGASKTTRSVSYTHLDVYKRQACCVQQAKNARTSPAPRPSACSSCLLFLAKTGHQIKNNQGGGHAKPLECVTSVHRNPVFWRLPMAYQAIGGVCAGLQQHHRLQG